ncbi:MAG: bifunctional metallophosphatase/5'-nucleotidase [Cellulosilyticaceae bacterium]
MKRSLMKCMLVCAIICLMSVSILGKTIDEQSRITILFTHDLHDHFLPQKIQEEGGIKSYGGYGRLQTLINQEREQDSELLLLDAGDFSMGTLFQTIYATKSPQLRVMGAMGYDVVTLGNHEFDFRAAGLAQSLESAMESGDILPQMVVGNIACDPLDPDQGRLNNAMKNYGVKPYTVLQKNGIRIGVFGLMGEDAQSNAPMAGVTFTDYVAQARHLTRLLREEEQVDLVVCLSHAGTSDQSKKSEDERLAKEVPDIDVIISGHTHTTLEQPKQVGDVLIASSGSYSKNLGKLVITQDASGKWQATNYELLSVDETISPDLAIETMISSYKDTVEVAYLTQYGYQFNQVLGASYVNFESEAMVGKKHEELRLGNLISDAYRYAIQQAEGEAYEPIAVSVAPAGIIRGSFIDGPITVSDVFTVSSLGIGEDGSAGYPLVSVYLTGKELRTICEVDASIAPIMSEAQLYLSGLNFTFNPHRVLFDKVTTCHLVDENKQQVSIEDEQLYRVVAGLYSAQMLSVVGDKSFGLLSIIPKDHEGIPITDFTPHIIKDPQTGGELKEWVALARYISSFQSAGKSEIPSQYAQGEGRKVIDNRTSLRARFSSPNAIAITIYAIAIMLVIVMLLLIRLLIKSIRKHVKLKK